jgi:hypothetical protein
MIPEALPLLRAIVGLWLSNGHSQVEAANETLTLTGLDAETSEELADELVTVELVEYVGDPENHYVVPTLRGVFTAFTGSTS